MLLKYNQNMTKCDSETEVSCNMLSTILRYKIRTFIQAAARPQIKPNNFSCESACRLLLSTSTIIISDQTLLL